MIPGRLVQKWSRVLVLAILLISCNSQTPESTLTVTPSPEGVAETAVPLNEPATGQIELESNAYGKYHFYLPTTVTPQSDLLVLVHGTPAHDESAETTAYYYIENWVDFAEDNSLILVAPVFDQLNFSSKDGEQALGGYRGLFGRNIPADEFALKIVENIQARYGLADKKFYLYGHSAGGQYVARFIVTHPERVKGAIITAAATYPQPKPDMAWPYGLGPLKTTLQWHNPDAETFVDVSPNVDNWLKALALPVTVIVGLNDLEYQPDRTGQKGNNRVVIARNWVDDMADFAARHGVESHLKLSLIPKLGHSSGGLLPYSQNALLPLLQNKLFVFSPDGQIQIGFSLADGGVPRYAVSYKKQAILAPSRLGFVFADAPPLNQNFTISRVERRAFDQTWEQPWGEVQYIRNHYNEMRVHLQEETGLERQLIITFRVFDDGFGFRYEFPGQPNLNSFYITDEQTEFAFTADHNAWWIPAFREQRYEYLYKQSPLSTLNKVHTPLTIESREGDLYFSIHEANLTDYAAMTLAGSGNNTLKAELVPWRETGIKVEANTPFQTPWRTVQIAETPGDLITSYLILNLNEPNALADVSWVKPGKYVGIWWAIHLRLYTWGSGPNHGATTENAKRYIDFAAEHGLDGVLVEGWNVGWDGNWVTAKDAFNFTTPYPDFDIEAVTRYAAEKGVRLIGHHETGADVENYERQMADAFAYYEGLGVDTVKTGYAGVLIDDKEWHHGQRMVRHYRRVVELAAQHHIMLNVHEPIKDTGLRRMYPNMMTREGGRGTEYNAWSRDGGNPPEHTTITPFTRMLSGPFDFTPGIFNLLYQGRYPENRVRTTLAKQLALYVVIYSPLQMVADMPENYVGHPAFQFIVDVPVDWQQTVVLNGKIGDYVTIARKDRHSDDWYIGSITDETKREFEIPLDFLDPDKPYVAEIYADGPDAGWEENPHAYTINNVIVTQDTQLRIQLASGGGQAIRLRPATETDMK